MGDDMSEENEWHFKEDEERKTTLATRRKSLNRAIEETRYTQRRRKKQPPQKGRITAGGGARDRFPPPLPFPLAPFPCRRSAGGGEGVEEGRGRRFLTPFSLSPRRAGMACGLERGGEQGRGKGGREEREKETPLHEVRKGSDRQKVGTPKIMQQETRKRGDSNKKSQRPLWTQKQSHMQEVQPPKTAGYK
jgi:hypothetical protein